MSSVSSHPSRASATTPWAYAKGFHEIEPESLAHFVDVMTLKVWSPIVWDEGHRRRDKFRTASVLALDFDDGRLSLDQAVAWVKGHGLRAVIGTTKSHGIAKVSPSGHATPACDRFRMVLFWSETIADRDTYEYNMDAAVKKFPADQSATDAARFFFPCTAIVHAQDGRMLRPRELPEDYLRAEELEAMAHLARARLVPSRTLPLWALHALESGSGVGGRHKMVYRLAANLIAYGFSEDDIEQLISRSPLADIGRDDVRRAVANGARRGREEVERFATYAAGCAAPEGEEGRAQ